MDYSDIYLESIRMKNFQSWKDLTINLAHGLNVIVARNGVGKSTIFKALKLIINPTNFNSEDRGDFLRYNSTSAEVYYTFSDNSAYSILINSRENIYYFIKDINNPKLEILGSTPPQDLLDKLAVVRRGNLIGNFIDFSKDMFLVNSDEEANNNMIDLLSSNENIDKIIEVAENTKLPIAKEAYKNILYKKRTVDGILSLCNYQNIDAKEQNIEFTEKLLEGIKLTILIEKYLSEIQTYPSIDDSIKLIVEDIEKFNTINKELISIQNYGRDLTSYKNLLDTMSLADNLKNSCVKIITSRFCNLLNFTSSLNELCHMLSKKEKEVKVDINLLNTLSLLDNLSLILKKSSEIESLYNEIELMRSEVQHDGGELYDCPIYGSIRFVDEECIPNY